MARRTRGYIDLAAVDEAFTLAERYTVDEIRKMAARFVLWDSIVTWLMAAAMLAAMLWLHLTVTNPGIHPGTTDAVVLGTLFAVFIASAIRHGRLRSAMVIVLAHHFAVNGIVRSRNISDAGDSGKVSAPTPDSEEKDTS